MWIMIFVEAVSALVCNIVVLQLYHCINWLLLVVVKLPIYFHQLGGREHRGSLS